MNKKSKEIVKKFCFTLVIVISIITIIGCPNTVSNKTDSGADKPSGNGIPWTPLYDPNDWSGLNDDQVIQKMRIKGSDDPIVRDKDGLSFGWRENKLCLLSTEDLYPTGNGNSDPNYPLNKAFEKIKAKIGDEGVAFIPTSFDSVSDGLKKRWIAAKETKYTKGGSMWLLPESGGCISSLDGLDNYISNVLKVPNNKLRIKGVYEFANTAQYWAVNKRMDIFVRASDTVFSHFADWHLVFVPKEGSPADLESYSFHYGPYTLRNRNKEDDPKYIPVDNCKNHVFTLSGMLGDYLSKKKVPEGIAKQVVKKFSDDKDKYDIYLVLGKIFRGDPSIASSTMFGYERVEYSFRNVLKLNGDAYTDRWINCWTRDESDQDGFPSLLPPPSP